MTQPTDIRHRSRQLPRLLDTFCCQGGASVGYHLAGFDVTGVDIHPQPRYPFAFIQAEAVEFIREHGAEFDFIHASPPCQHDSKCQRIQKREHPDLIAPTRAALESIGRPWVIENVGDAVPKLRDPVMLCGTMFRLETYRHRFFETGGWSLPQPGHPAHRVPQAKMGRPIPPGHYGQFIGNFSGVDHARHVMGVPWMNRDGIRECVPPAYTQWLGTHAVTALDTAAAA
ncbi:SAM-dependent methyltransferase [Streptomyces sp. NPDC006654]|uniref:SAM-dependent methyltransferase n=1 Tax=Streptomyces sp. NPDC006654 TaxID=3156897 RepID=UPI0033F5A411